MTSTCGQADDDDDVQCGGRRKGVKHSNDISADIHTFFFSDPENVVL